MQGCRWFLIISNGIVFSGTMDRVCAFCSRGEKSLLGQGELMRYEPTPGFNPFRKQLSRNKRGLSDVDDSGGRKGSQHLTWRRSRGPLKHQRYNFILQVVISKKCFFLSIIFLHSTWHSLKLWPNVFQRGYRKEQTAATVSVSVPGHVRCRRTADTYRRWTDIGGIYWRYRCQPGFWKNRYFMIF